MAADPPGPERDESGDRATGEPLRDGGPDLLDRFDDRIARARLLPNARVPTQPAERSIVLLLEMR